MNIQCRICGRPIEVDIDAINDHYETHRTVEQRPTLRALLAFWFRKLRRSR